MEDKDNIYIYDEDTDTVESQISATEEIVDNETLLDSSGPNYSQITDDVRDNCADVKDGRNQSSPFLLMFKLMLNPIEGWKSVRRSGLSVEKAQQGCLYPLVALLALSKFALLAYNPSMGLSDALTDGLSSFVSFFFGYFCIIIGLKIFLPGGARKAFDTDFGKIFVIMSLSTLCLFFTLADALPMLWAILIFLPLWTIYIVCRGTKFLKFPEHKQITSTFILCLLIVFTPVVLSWLFNLLLPS